MGSFAPFLTNSTNCIGNQGADGREEDKLQEGDPHPQSDWEDPRQGK